MTQRRIDSWTPGPAKGVMVSAIVCAVVWGIVGIILLLVIA